MIKNLKSLFVYLNFNFAGILNRCAAIAVLTALLAPVFLVQPFYKTAAKTLPIPEVPAIVSVPPEAFTVSGNNSLSKSFISKFGSLLSLSGKTILGFFDKPKTPTGLEQAENQLIPAENLTSENKNANLLLTLPDGSVRFDFDGDGKADLGRWMSSATEWKVKNSSNGNFATTTIGSSSSTIAPGDFDGDGKTDAAVFSAGTWTIKRSSDNQTITVSFGTTGDNPVVGDYDGDGLADCAVFRPSTNTWWILQSSNANTVSNSFGSSGDITAQGNFDGDTKTDIAVFRPSTGDWHVLGSSAGYYSFHWGIASDIPVPADFDGDGKTDFAVYRGSSGTWYVSKSSTNNAQYFTQGWGNYGDQPVPADYDGDGQDDFAIWRPTTGVWHIIKSSNSAYDYQTLGQTGDTAISSAYLKQIGGAVAGYDLAKARLSPKNSTGGTDLYSRNFSWGTSLVGLSGRAGMGAGFGISYNSLIWTKEPVSNSIYFDADNSNVSPGFRFGFPTIEPIYWDKDAERFNYLMVTPSGARVEFRQIGASDTYETADSSYTQLKTTGATNPNDPVENITITLSGTDGSKMTYLWRAGAFRCSEIKDRNGNYITVVHNEQGLLTSVTDTLGRIISVNYDAELYPTSITQTWKTANGTGSDVTHTWATFTYTTQEITTNFSSLTVVGPPNGTILKVLQKITFSTESNGAGPNTVFSYNTWGQVKQITNYAADNHELNHTALNLPATATNSETDCPRFTETRRNIENFNDGNDVVINNSIPESSTYTLPGSITGSASLIKVWMTDHPDNLISRTYVGSSGWKEGLTIATEDCISTNCSGTDRKRWTWSYWIQDDENLSYIQNPRIIESKVGDPSNTKRSTTEYYTVPLSNVAVYGLVKEVDIYGADQTTIWKKAVMEYNLDTAYTTRRIIGLPSKTELYGREASGLNLISKTTYAYDDDDFSNSLLNQNISTVIQHDNTNFSSSFETGRGNLTSTKQWDATDSENSSKAINITFKYNIAGAAVEQTDPAGRSIQISYTDAFNDNQNRNTFAFPTKFTDSAEKFSEIKYRFDTGANVWAKSPSNSLTPTEGKKTEREYDSVGRLLKETLINTSNTVTYTRYEYPINNIQSKVYSVITDTNNNGADANDEFLSESWTNGAGSVLRSRTAHPDSTGGWSASIAEYDILGRIRRSTIPTEVSVSNENNPLSWQPAGDDDRGLDEEDNPVWLWASQEYDWKGRVTKIINTDGTDRLISYVGCGCAGGQVTTIQGESVPVPGETNVYTRRTQKIYEDILGRTEKTENLKWDGNVYSTIKSIFNGRDQAIELKQFDGDDTSSTFQITTRTFDGFGRLKTQHLPEQDTSAVTTYNYNSDDSISSIVDGRGATTSYVYNDSRGLLTNINYSVPTNSTIPASSNVSFTYDTLGNRTQMTDGLGVIDYEYNQLSQMTAEERNFTDTLADAPTTNSGNYRIEYTYTLGGQLKSLKDPFGQENTYSFDKIGRVSEVKSSGYGDLSANQLVVSDMKYRAFGSLKEADYGNGTQTTMQYNTRLQPSAYRLTDGTQILFGKDYYYTTGTNNDNDGLVKRSVHYDDTLSSSERTKHNRINIYDAVSRIEKADSGETSSGIPGGFSNGPFQQTYQYTAFNNLKQINDRDFETNVTGCVGCPRLTFYSETFANNRTTNSSYGAGGNGSGISNYVYDQDGRLMTRGSETYQYNAAGQRISADMTGTTPDPSYAYDGDGKLVKLSENGTVKNYHIISSVLNVTVSELTTTGAMDKGYMLLPTGANIAWMKDNEVKFTHNDPSGASEYTFKMDKTNVGRTIFEPTGRGATNPGYTGGGPCGSNCPGGYNPPGGFDGLEILMARKRQQQWQDSVLWNLEDYINSSIIVGSSPPAGWDRYHDNRNPGNDNRFHGGAWVGGIQTSVRNFSESPGGFWFVYAVGNELGDLDGYYIPAGKDITDRLSERLKDSGCKAFLDKVRGSLDIDKTFEELLKNALEKGPKNKKGIIYDPNIANAEKSSSGKYNQLTLKPQAKDEAPTPELQQKLLSQRLDTYVNLVIHALIHRAGVEGHEKFAEAANGALSDSEKKEKDNQLPLRGKKEKKDTFDARNSDYFMKILKKKCPNIDP